MSVEESTQSMRINRFLARAGLGSRRNVEQLILTGQIEVNGELCRELFQRIGPHDTVIYREKQIKLPDNYSYIALNKPVDVVVSRRTGNQEQSVFDLLKIDNMALVYAGRLDKMSRGLLLFSDDGNFIQQMTHPNHKVARHYLLQVRSEEGLGPEMIQQRFLEGISDGDELLQASRIEIEQRRTNFFKLDVSLMNGRKRQLRRMCEACGLEVLDLFRYAIGRLKLENLALDSGEWQNLSPADLELLIERPPAILKGDS